MDIRKVIYFTLEGYKVYLAYPQGGYVGGVTSTATYQTMVGAIEEAEERWPTVPWETELVSYETKELARRFRP